jgi:hypothetical protein
MVNLSTLRHTFPAIAAALLAGCAAPVAHPFDPAAIELVAPGDATAAAVWAPGRDGVIAVAGTPSGFVATRAAYANYRLHVEWRWPGKPGNSGVLLHIASGPKDGVWPVSQQVQLKHGAAGDLLPMAGASFVEPLTSAPGGYPPVKAHTAPDSERTAGEWNSMDVVSRAGVIDVAINGVAQNRVTGATPAAGRVGFQLEGAPYALRNLRLEPLD